MKSYQLRLEDAEMEALKKDAHRHEKAISEYLRFIIKKQREEDSRVPKMTSHQLAEEVLDDNRPFDTEWIRHIRRTKGFNGILEIAKNTTYCYAPQGCTDEIIERAAQIVAHTMDDETM